ncbi:MAG: hypothetical protein KQI81_01875 [Deltaproteobacteria bacterium]|nr:hypothetical protein [Deltaproteobacteria bacterium]
MKTTAHKKPGKIETRLSMAFMAILLIAGAGVFMRQFRINPAVVALRPESHQQALPSDPDQSAVVDTTGSKLAPFSPPERFGPDTLYEKINGRADLYLSSGFVSLSTQRFSMDNAAGNWVEVFIYDMATPENAFSVFSMQRREGARADGTVPNAYRTENALFMAHEKFYLEIIGTDASDALQQATGQLARAFVQTHGGATVASAPGADMFPASGLQAESLQLVTANAFGYEQLDRIYTAEYLIDGTRLTAFVSDRQTAAAAAALAAQYRQTLVSYGAASADAPHPFEGAAVIRFFDTYEIIFSRGKYLAGIHEAGSLEAAGSLAGQLAGHLERLGE